MKRLVLSVLVLVPFVSFAQFEGFGKAAGDIAAKTAKGEVEKKVNAKLKSEAAKNQCSFKTNSDVLEPGCEAKLNKLVQALIDAKKQLDAAGAKNYRFEVSGHTDSTGDAAKNKTLSEKRAATIVKEMVNRGVGRGEIIAIGRGSEQMLVKPDDTAAKKAKNRRYEIQVRL